MFLYFQIKYSSFLAEILSFTFYLVNSECGAYLAVDQSLVYGSYSNMFLLFFSLILSLIPVLKPSFLIHVLVSFCFSPESTGILPPCLFIFNSQWKERNPFTRFPYDPSFHMVCKILYVNSFFRFLLFFISMTTTF